VGTPESEVNLSPPMHDRTNSGGPQHRSTYSNGLAADVLPAAPAFGSKRFSPGNPDDRATNGLDTWVSAAGRVFSFTKAGGRTSEDSAFAESC
jgi:hypothetical protein